MSSDERGRSYVRGARIVFNLVRDWTGEAPRFVFPPADVALIADLRDCGDKLVLNDGARELLALLIRRCMERTGQAPTVTMLRCALEVAGTPFETKPFADFGFKGKVVPPSGAWS